MRTAQQLTIGLWAVFSLMACSVEDDFVQPEPQAIDVFAADTIEHTYSLQFECEPPLYDDEAQTRATTTWNEGTTVYLRLYSTNYNYSNSSYWYPAKAVYNNGNWTITVTGSPGLTESRKCEAYYFVDPVTSSTSYVSLNHLTAIYKGTDDVSTYSHPSSSEWVVKTTLKPMTWRMRFRKLTYNQNFTLPSGTSTNELEFPTRYTIGSGVITWGNSDDISLSTNQTHSGNYYYSKYIYGRFKNSAYSTSTNKLTVKYSDSESYYRNVAFSKLVVGESGYFTLPTSSNYSSLGWSLSDEYLSPSSWTSTNHSNSSTDYKTWSITVKAGDVLSFTYSVSSESGCDKFNARLSGASNVTLVDGASGNISNRAFRFTFRTAGTYTLRMEYVKDGSLSSGSDQASVTDIKISHDSNAVFTPYEEPLSPSSWTSTNHSNSSTSYQTWSISVKAGDVLSFTYSVSSESGCDKFNARLSGASNVTLVDGASGTISNRTHSYTFTTSGTYTLRMEYVKDGSLSSGSDQVSVSDIKIRRNS